MVLQSLSQRVKPICVFCVLGPVDGDLFVQPYPSSNRPEWEAGASLKVGRISFFFFFGLVNNLNFVYFFVMRQIKVLNIHVCMTLYCLLFIMQSTCSRLLFLWLLGWMLIFNRITNEQIVSCHWNSDILLSYMFMFSDILLYWHFNLMLK